MFTVGETRPISDANEREQQTKQRWIQQVAGNSRPRRFNTETPLDGADFFTIANKFGTFFSNIGQNLANKIPAVDVSYKAYLQGNYINSLFFLPTTPKEVESVAILFKNKKSSCFDGISTKLNNDHISDISVPLSEIINLSLQTGIVPDKMKIAEIIPLFKSGNTSVIVIIDQYLFFLHCLRFWRK